MTFKTLDQSMPQLQSSTTLPMVGGQTPSITPLGTQRARLLIGSSRKGEAEDPEIYVATIAAILSAYPEDVAIAVTHPVTGLATRTKFGGLALPAEVKDACEAAMAPRREAERKAAAERHRQETLAQRAAWLERQRGTDADRIRRIADEFIADVGGELKRDRRAFSDMTIEEAEHRLAQPPKPITPEIAADMERLMKLADSRADPADRLSPTGPDHEGRRG